MEQAITIILYVLMSVVYLYIGVFVGLALLYVFLRVWLGVVHGDWHDTSRFEE